MLIRLLVAVLALVGPLPLRVCTCAASVPTRPARAATAPATVKKCRCAGCRPPAAATTRDTGPVRCEAPPPPTTHDRDCPAVNPRPVARDSAAPAAPDAPAESAAPTAESVPLTSASVPIEFERTRAPRTPLYITFLALRN